jgi:tellurite resistance protein
MTLHFKPPLVPASFFGIVLGIAGLGNAWRLAHQVWQLPAMPGEILNLLAAIVWALLVILFVLKWIFDRPQARGEAFHPVQCCFIGLLGVSAMLVALGAQPYSRMAALVLFFGGAAFTLAFAVWRTGMLWQGGRDDNATTPVLYLPTVGGGFVTAIVASSLGYPDLARLGFGAAVLSWLAIESVLLHRYYMAASMPPPLRPTLGIMLAPPTVGTIAWLSINGGQPDMVAYALLGYGLMLALILLRMLPWIMQQPFTAGYWGFTFGITALGGVPLRFKLHGDTGAIAQLAPYLFVAANIAVGLIALATLRLIVQRLLPPPLPVTA